MTMLLEVIWALTLTVCNQGECVSQRIEEYAKQSTCLTVMREYQAMPRDTSPRWDTVKYECIIKDGFQI